MNTPGHPSGFMGPPENSDPLYRHLLRFMPAGGLHVDLGSGRGRFLQISKKAGMEVLGVDAHRESVDECLSSGVEAVEADVIEFLNSSQLSAAAITAIHLVEHLHPDELRTFLSLVHDNLESGGRLLIVTPNFRDWKVVTEYFWLDPTHVKPYPSALLSRFASDAGLATVKTFTTSGVRVGRRMRVTRHLQRLRFGREFGRPNLVVVCERKLVD